MEKYTETCVEFLENGDHCTISTGKRKYISKVKKWAKDYTEVSYVENADGSICAKVPIDWFRFPSPKIKRTYTNEQKQILSERMKAIRRD